MTAVRVPGRIVWRNEVLAREMGFATADDLLDALSYRLLRPGEEIGGRKTVTLYADHYGGDGIAPYLGSARAGFTEYGDILLKGIGLTPLFRKPREDDFPHAHGGCNLNEAMAEAIHGEISRHLFTREPARILAIIDQDDWTVWPDGVTRHPRVILARAGLQLRPAHMLARVAREQGRCAELFERMARECGQLVPGDLRATMLRVIDDHAEAVAEQVRWRITHGCISTSNMLMSGGMLDTVIQCAHPRIADIVPARKNPERVYFRDYLDRVKQMGKIYRVLRMTEQLAPLDVYQEMERAYRHHLDATLLRAAGFKPRAATFLRNAHPELVRRFTDVLVRMASLRNVGSFRRSRALVKDHAVADILGLLRAYPAGGNLWRALAPVYRGNPHHIARKRSTLRQLVDEFTLLYEEVLRAAETTCRAFYDPGELRRSIAARVRFENAPLDRLYRTRLWEDLDATAARYKETNDPRLVEALIRERITASSRNIDTLLSEPRRLADGGIELNVRTIDGVRYSVYAAPGFRRIRADEKEIAVDEPYGIHDGKYPYALPDSVELREILETQPKPGPRLFEASCDVPPARARRPAVATLRSAKHSE
ncbi:MAG TPA: hypothetical protein VGF48_16290 [Thermoanaerobaculia bacterium]|jgi:hypothetical protein